MAASALSEQPQVAQANANEGSSKAAPAVPARRIGFMVFRAYGGGLPVVRPWHGRAPVERAGDQAKPIMPRAALGPSREECPEADRHPAVSPAAQGQAVSGEAERQTAHAVLQRCCRDPRRPGSRGNRRGSGDCLGRPDRGTFDRLPKRHVCRSRCRSSDLPFPRPLARGPSAAMASATPCPAARARRRAVG